MPSMVFAKKPLPGQTHQPSEPDSSLQIEAVVESVWEGSGVARTGVVATLRARKMDAKKAPNRERNFLFFLNTLIQTIYLYHYSTHKRFCQGVIEVSMVFLWGLRSIIAVWSWGLRSVVLFNIPEVLRGRHTLGIRERLPKGNFLGSVRNMRLLGLRVKRC